MTGKNRIFGLVFALTIALAGLPAMVSAGDEGCVSCHAGELSLNLVMKKFEAHPPIELMVNNLPGDCLMCHAEGSDLTLSPIIHKAHFANDAEMACTSCHGMDAETGIASVKSGAKNW